MVRLCFPILQCWGLSGFSCQYCGCELGCVMGCGVFCPSGRVSYPKRGLVSSVVQTRGPVLLVDELREMATTGTWELVVSTNRID